MIELNVELLPRAARLLAQESLPTESDVMACRLCRKASRRLLVNIHECRLCRYVCCPREYN